MIYIKYIFTLYLEGQFDVEPDLNRLIHTTAMFKDIHRLIGKYNGLKRPIKLDNSELVKYYSHFFHKKIHLKLIKSYYNKNNDSVLWKILFDNSTGDKFIEKIIDEVMDIVNTFVLQMTEIIIKFNNLNGSYYIYNILRILQDMIQLDKIIDNLTHIYNDF